MKVGTAICWAVGGGLFFVAAAVGCRHSQPLGSSHRAQSPVQSPNPKTGGEHIELFTWPCHGSCAVEHVVLRPDGLVWYRGVEFVGDEWVGVSIGRVSSGRAQALFELARRVELPRARTHYPETVVFDAGHTFVNLLLDGEARHAHITWCTQETSCELPRELEQLVDQLGELREEVETWVHRDARSLLEESDRCHELGARQIEYCQASFGASTLSLCQAAFRWSQLEGSYGRRPGTCNAELQSLSLGLPGGRPGSNFEMAPACESFRDTVTQACVSHEDAQSRVKLAPCVKAVGFYTELYRSSPWMWQRHCEKAQEAFTKRMKGANEGGE